MSLDFLRSQFTISNGEPDMSSPQIDKEYKLSKNITDTGFLLIHKLAFFPEHLKRYLSFLDTSVKTEIDKTTVKGWSALHIACKNGVTESVKLLLEHGSNVNLQENDGWSALIMACRYSNTNSIETVKLLLNHPQINVNLQDNEGWTGLMMACRYSNTDSNIETVKLLLNNQSIDVNLQHKDGYTSLMMACINCNTDSNIETVKLLLNHPEINVNLRDNQYRTALIIACRNGNNVETVKLLLQHPKIQIDPSIFSYVEANDKDTDELISILLDYINIDDIDVDRIFLKYIKAVNKNKEFQRIQKLDLGSLLYHYGKKYI